LELAAIAGRLAQFTGAALLFGWPLFRLYAQPGKPLGPEGGLRAVLGVSALLVLCGGALSLAAQAALMTGTPESARDPAVLWDVAVGTRYGHGLTARLLMALAVLAIALKGPRSRGGWKLTVGLGGVLVASFAWTGHAAGGEGLPGLVHRSADIVHLLAAAVWLGALPPLWLLVLRGLGRARGTVEAAADGLARFSGIGPAVVATLVLTGLVNSWMLIGTPQPAVIMADPYGQVLLVKLALFGAMLGLAAMNRYVLTPRLAAGSGAPPGAMNALRLSLSVEIVLGLAVLGAVSALGLLPPPH